MRNACTMQCALCSVLSQVFSIQRCVPAHCRWGGEEGLCVFPIHLLSFSLTPLRTVIALSYVFWVRNSDCDVTQVFCAQSFLLGWHKVVGVFSMHLLSFSHTSRLAIPLMVMSYHNLCVQKDFLTYFFGTWCVSPSPSLFFTRPRLAFPSSREL